MQGFAGKVAVVTGAGSGIGQALAVELARSGASVAISDVNTEGLADTEERLKAIGAQVKADRLDVTERGAFELYADAVMEHFGKVNQIYNNAGIAFAGDVEVTEFKDIEKVMDVDFWGVVNTRIESMIRSAPSSNATAATGIAPCPIAATVAESARNDEPGTPAIPFDVSISTRTAVTCSPRLRSTPSACARNKTQIDRYSVAPSRLNE